MRELYADAPAKRNEFPCVRSGVYAPQNAPHFQAQLDLLHEPQRLHHVGQTPPNARFAICQKSPSGKVSQELFPLNRLEWAMGQVMKMTQRDKLHSFITQATLRAEATSRRVPDIIFLNAVWVDIDLAHVPPNFKGRVPEGDLSDPRAVDRLAGLLAMQIVDAGLPPPTYIISTGGGLCPKWIFDFAIPSQARPRWQTLQNHVVERIGAITGTIGETSWAWPVDRAACDASRVLRLVGTHNPRWNAPCRVAWVSDKQYDFDWLADEVLPYTRAEVSAWRDSAKLREDWDRNRAVAELAGIRLAGKVGQKTTADMIEDEAARSLWALRFEFGQAVLESRGGAANGSRNNHFWPLANALAHSCSSVDQLAQELAALHQALFRTDGWTRAEAMRSAGSVISRLKTGQLYKMTTETFMKSLGVTPQERQAFGSMLISSSAGHNAKRDQWSLGAMGFEKIQGLDSEAFIAETRRRQALAGPRSAQTRSTTYAPDIRDRAMLMRSEGFSVRKIAAELGVSVGSVSAWCSARSE